MINDIKCDMKKCKNVSLETGRFISELSSKAISQPAHTIQEKDIERLGNYLDCIEHNCGITDDSIKSIKKYYQEAKSIYPTVKGSRFLPPLSDLMNSIDSANSDCRML